MIKYAKVINEATKECQVGLGTNTEYYTSIGMTQQEVEQCDWNGCFYLAGYVPQKPEPTKDEQIAELKSQLNELDVKSTRSIRAMLAQTATAEDRAFLSNLETQAEDLRQQIKDLQGEK